ASGERGDVLALEEEKRGWVNSGAITRLGAASWDCRAPARPQDIRAHKRCGLARMVRAGARTSQETRVCRPALDLQEARRAWEGRARPGRVPSRPRESQETPLGRDGTRPSQETQFAG